MERTSMSMGAAVALVLSAAAGCATTSTDDASVRAQHPQAATTASGSAALGASDAEPYLDDADEAGRTGTGSAAASAGRNGAGLLGAQQQQPTRQQQERATDRRGSAAAQQAGTALASPGVDRLDQGGAVAQEGPRFVVAMSGGALFEPGGAALSPDARERLDRLADAMTFAAGSEFVVEGYPMASDPNEDRATLTQRRAEAVRDHLIARGVPARSISAVGRTDVISSTVGDRGVEVVVRPTR